MKVLKKLSQKLSKSSSDTLLKHCCHSDISTISLRDWEAMNKGEVKHFFKKVFRFLFKILIRIIRGKIVDQLNKYHNEIFKEFGVPESHLLEVASMKKELRLRCDAIIKNDPSKELLADIEKETREGMKNEKDYKTIGSILATINLNKGTHLTIDNTTVKEYYNYINELNNA